LDQNQVSTQLSKDQLKVKLTVSNIVVEKDSADFLVVNVKGFREITSYNDAAFNKQIIFENVLTLKKIPRSAEHPWGLLVENWEESVFKAQ
jgi:hypothetical protein